ncbi:AAA family ATPase [Actinomadura sp. 9N215]|uniref:AAA family ATPase n=1 Tax=Actinomadura sp. 9N215 TaxID=3375150 RepID=UPI00379E8E1E
MTNTERLAGWPTFSRELEGTLAVHSQYILHGNIRDLYLIPPDDPSGAKGRGTRLESVATVLWEGLRRSGYQCLLRFDMVDGLSVHSKDQEDAARRLLGDKGALDSKPSLDKLRTHLSSVVNPTAEPPDGSSPGGASPGGSSPGGAARAVPAPAAPPRAAVLIDYASRISRTPGSLDQSERDFFLFCQKLANTAQPHPAAAGDRTYALFNPVIWLVDSERDLPSWLAAGTERIRTIGLALPGLDERHTAARLLAARFGVRFGAREPDLRSAEERLIDRFVQETDGMTLHAMHECCHLAHDRSMGFNGLPDAVRVYKLGVADNPWASVRLRERINAGTEPEPEEETRPREETGPDGRPRSNSLRLRKEGVDEGGGGLSLHRRVKGQKAAVTKTLDILMRAALGLSGSQATSTGTRPRGVLFFAGPTGVGKTELAKAVSELLFGDTESYLRFDMSEFSAAHAADRLIGAPPGYVGFEAGGELTSAIRRRPFRVVLFDEIEKAHSSILDKFLQILEDGRLTDGQGITTYFSECVLIFTSNLGVVDTDPRSQEKTVKVRADGGMSYDKLKETILEGIKQEFTIKLGRPELLNRFGDNIVVFDFISLATADRIFDTQLANIVRRVSAEQRVGVHIDGEIRELLRAACTADRDNGGRGIGNALESKLINPLARELFRLAPEPGTAVRITAVDLDVEPVTLTLGEATGT